MTTDPDGGGSARRFALHLEDLDEIGCRSADVEGFFGGAPDADGRTTFRLIAATPGDAEAWRLLTGRAATKGLGNAEVWILDDSGRRIGGYFMADVRLTAKAPHPTGAGAGEQSGESSDLDIGCHLVQPPHPLAGPIWERWRHGGPTRRDEWAELRPDGRAAWLEVVRLAWTAPGTDRPAGSVFELDGAYVEDRPSFYCALGEAVNGPGGYFGASLDALIDCLRGGFGATAPFTLLWHGPSGPTERLRSLADDTDGAFHDRLLDVLGAAGVTIGVPLP